MDKPVNTSVPSTTPMSPVSGANFTPASTPVSESSSKETLDSKPKEEKKVVADSEERNQKLIAIAESIPLKGMATKVEWARSIVIHHKELVAKHLKEKKVLPIKANWWVENEKEIPEALQAYFDFLEEEGME